MTTYYTVWASSLQPVVLTSDGESLTGLYLSERAQAEIAQKAAASADWIQDDKAAPFAEAKQQLEAYFAGRQTTFDLPLKLEGTPFQRQVWDELRKLPYGVTVSYGELARRIGNPKACRAVGLANGQNPVSIVVPCHRVIGANGKLTGYSGGLSRKETLLAFERKIVENSTAENKT